LRGARTGAWRRSGGFGGDDEGVRRARAAVAMTALRFEGNSVRYGDISGLVDQSEVHVDVQVRGPSMLVFSGAWLQPDAYISEIGNDPRRYHRRTVVGVGF
jgi:hypothetical protein